MNCGLNTRSTSKAPHESRETAEAWIFDHLGKIIDALDLPEKFLLCAHSWGGAASMYLACIKPERIESMFLLSPAGTEGYDEKTYEQRSTYNIPVHHSFPGPKAGLIFQKSEAKQMIDTYAAKQNALVEIGKLPGCVSNMIINMMVDGMIPLFKESGVSDELWKEFRAYYKMMIQRPGEADITMYMPFMHNCMYKHHFAAKDRMDQASINFPVAMAFGDQDCFSSDVGAERILNACKVNNGGRVNLFKLKGGHAFYLQDP